MMKTNALALGAALLLSGGAAFAQTAAPDSPRAGHGQRMFEQLDSNRDGRVTWEEAWGIVTTRFATADADRSGGVSQAEFATLRGPRAEGAPAPRPEWQQRMEQRRGAMFRMLDSNSDGQVTLAEMQPFAQARFRAADANADGAVTRDEVPQRGHRHGARPDATPPAR